MNKLWMEILVAIRMLALKKREQKYKLTGKWKPTSLYAQHPADCHLGHASGCRNKSRQTEKTEFVCRHEGHRTETRQGKKGKMVQRSERNKNINDDTPKEIPTQT